MTGQIFFLSLNLHITIPFIHLQDTHRSTQPMATIQHAFKTPTLSIVLAAEERIQHLQEVHEKIDKIYYQYRRQTNKEKLQPARSTTTSIQNWR